MGGSSEERKVSLDTGKSVFQACIDLGYSVKAFEFKDNYKM